MYTNYTCSNLQPVIRSQQIFNELQNFEEEQLAKNEIIMMNEFFVKKGINKIINDKKRSNLRYDNLLPMAGSYARENIIYGNHLDRVLDYQIFCYEKKLFDNQGNPINSSPLNFNTGGILVMDNRGNLFFSHKQRDLIHHSTFLSGSPVAYACMLEIRDGVIVDERPWSGHYLPTHLQQIQFHDRLSKDFTVDIDNNLKLIFLKSNPDFEKNRCAISHLPKLDAIKLSCGHSFNRIAFKKWFEKKQVCPLDGHEIDVSKIIRDTTEIQNSHASIVDLLSERQRISASLDRTVVQLRLDDRNDELSNLSTIFNLTGVFLFLKRDSHFSRVGEIANKLGITYFQEIMNPQSFNAYYIVNGRSYSGNHKISEIKKEHEFHSIIPAITAVTEKATQ